MPPSKITLPAFLIAVRDSVPTEVAIAAGLTAIGALSLWTAWTASSYWGSKCTDAERRPDMQGEHCAPGAGSDEGVSDTEVVAAEHDAGNDISDCADRSRSPPTDPLSETGNGKGSWRYFSHASCGDLKALADTYRNNGMLETVPTDSVMQDCSALLMELHSREGDLLDETHRGNATQELEKGQQFTLLKLRSALEFLATESREELASGEWADGSRSSFYEYDLSTNKDFVDRALSETYMNGRFKERFDLMRAGVAKWKQTDESSSGGNAECVAALPIEINYKSVQHCFGS